MLTALLIEGEVESHDAEAFALGHIAFIARDGLEGTGNADLGLMVHMPILV